MKSFATECPPDSRFLLTTDLGSSNFKAAVFSADLKRLSECSVPVSYSRQQDNFWEMDPEEVCTKIRRLHRETVRAAGLNDDPADLPLAVCSQAQTFTILDPSGRPLIPLISWIDSRAREEANELGRHFANPFHSHCSFPAPLPQLMISKLLWLKKHNPDMLRAPNRVVGIQNLAAETMCGRIHATDTNIAAMNGIYSLVDHSWYYAILEFCGLNPDTLDTPVAAGRKIVSDAGCTVMFAGNDQTAGAIANGAAPDRIIATFGTALVAYRRSGDVPGPYGPSCWGMYPGGGFYELGTRDQGCLALDRSRKQLMPGSSVSEFFQAAETGRHRVNGETGFFYPETTWSGTFRLDAEKAYAAAEGISFSLRDLIFDTMKSTPIHTVIAIGGGSRSDFWMQLTADILNIPVRRGSGDSLQGVAMMFFGRDAADDRTVVFQPNQKSVRLLNQRFKRWKTASEPRSTADLKYVKP